MLGIAETAALFRSRRISPRELVAAHLERAALDPDINAIATLTEQRAHADAERAERELASGHDRGPLQGIPISLKDNIDVAGVRTTAGSRLYADRVPALRSAIARLVADRARCAARQQLRGRLADLAPLLPPLPKP